jgi:hypothetical protein
MRRPTLALLWLTLAPALASCAFVLDFDSLQSGGGGGQGGQLLTGGSAGTLGGSAGKSGGDDICGEGVVGLVLDGVDETLQGDTYYRVTAASGDDDFFLSSYGLVGGEPVVTLYRLPAEAAGLEEIGTISGRMIADLELGEPASAAGLVFQPFAGLVHAYLALRKLTGDGARVWHTVFNSSTLEMLSVSAVVSDDYWQVSPYNHPVATNFGSVVGAAWLNEDQTVGVELSGEVHTLAKDTPAMTVALLAAEDGSAAVLYGTEEGLFVERPGSDPLPVGECQTAPGAYLSTSTTSTTIPGFYIGSWTKFGVETDENDAFLTSEGRGVYCNADGCVLQAPSCDGGAENNLIRNPATAVIHRPGSQTGLVEVVQARPQLVPGEEEGSVVARLALTQAAVDFGIPPFENPAVAEPLGPEIQLSAQETSEARDFRGPDWPVLANVAPDHYLVAWIEPTDTGDALRIQRYRLCLP